MTDIKRRPAFRIKTLARALGVSRTAVHRWIKNGKLKAGQPGGYKTSYRIPRAAVVDEYGEQFARDCDRIAAGA